MTKINASVTSKAITDEAIPEFTSPEKRRNRRTSIKELQLKGKSTKEAFINLVNKKLAPVGMKVKDLSESWTDGLALAFLIASYVPEFLLRDTVTAVFDSPIELIDECLNAAEDLLQVPAFVDAEDIADGVVDDMCMMTYLSNFFRKQPQKINQLTVLCEEEETETDDTSRKRRRSSVDSGRGKNKKSSAEDKSVSTDESWQDSDNKSELSKDLLSSVHLSSVLTYSTETDEKIKQGLGDNSKEILLVQEAKFTVSPKDVISTPEALALLDCRRQHVNESSSDSHFSAEKKNNVAVSNSGIKKSKNFASSNNWSSTSSRKDLRVEDVNSSLEVDLYEREGSSVAIFGESNSTVDDNCSVSSCCEHSCETTSDSSTSSDEDSEITTSGHRSRASSSCSSSSSESEIGYKQSSCSGSNPPQPLKQSGGEASMTNLNVGAVSTSCHDITGNTVATGVQVVNCDEYGNSSCSDISTNNSQKVCAHADTSPENLIHLENHALSINKNTSYTQLEGKDTILSNVSENKSHKDCYNSEINLGCQSSDTAASKSEMLMEHHNDLDSGHCHVTDNPRGHSVSKSFLERHDCVDESNFDIVSNESNSDTDSNESNSDIDCTVSKSDIDSTESKSDIDSTESKSDIDNNENKPEVTSSYSRSDIVSNQSNAEVASSHGNPGSDYSRKDVISKSGKFKIIEVHSRSVASSGYIKVEDYSENEKSHESINNSDNCNLHDASVAKQPTEPLNPEFDVGNRKLITDIESTISLHTNSINNDSENKLGKNGSNNSADVQMKSDKSNQIENSTGQKSTPNSDSDTEVVASSSSYCVTRENYAKLETNSDLIDNEDSLSCSHIEDDIGQKEPEATALDDEVTSITKQKQESGTPSKSDNIETGSSYGENDVHTPEGAPFSEDTTDEEAKSEVAELHSMNRYDSREDNVLMNMFGSKTDSNVSDQYSVLYNMKRLSTDSLVRSLEHILSHQADVIYGNRMGSFRNSTEDQSIYLHSEGDSESTDSSTSNKQTQDQAKSADVNLDKTWSDFSDVCQYFLQSSSQNGLEKCRSLDSVLIVGSPADTPIAQRSPSLDFLIFKDYVDTPEARLCRLSGKKSLNRLSHATNQSPITESIEGYYISEYEQEFEDLGNPWTQSADRDRSQATNDVSMSSANDRESSAFSSSSCRKQNPIPKIKRKINQKEASSDKDQASSLNEKKTCTDKSQILSPPPKPGRSAGTSSYGLSSLLADVTRAFNLPASTELLSDHIKVKGSTDLTIAPLSPPSLRNQLEYDLFNPTLSDTVQRKGSLPTSLLTNGGLLNDWLKDSIKDLKCLQEGITRHSNTTASRMSQSDSRLFYGELKSPYKRVSFTPDCTNDLSSPVIHDTPHYQSEYDLNLLHRINEAIQPKNLFVRNFTTSWIDGQALSALVDCKIPGFYHLHKTENSFSVLAESIEVCYKHLGIEKAVTPFELLVPNMLEDRVSFKNFLENLLNCNNYQDVSNVTKVESREVALTRKLYNSTRKLSRHQELIHHFNKILSPYSITVNDFKKTWESGEALLCLIDTFVSGVLADGMKLNPDDRITFGLKTAMEYLNILPIVSAEELRYSQHPNQAATYLVQFLGLHDCISSDPDPRERKKILSGKSDITSSTHAYDTVNQSSIGSSVTSGTPPDPKQANTSETNNGLGPTSTTIEVFKVIRSELTPDSVTSKRIATTESHNSGSYTLESPFDDSSSEAYYSIPDKTIFLNRHLPHSCINSILHILHDRFSRTFELDDALCFKVEEFNVCSRPVIEEGSVNLKMKISEKACDHEKLHVLWTPKRSSKVITGVCHNSFQLIPRGRNKKVTYSPIVDSLGSSSEDLMSSCEQAVIASPKQRPKWKRIAKNFMKRFSNRKKRKILKSIGVQVSILTRTKEESLSRVVGKSFLYETEKNKTKRIASYKLSCSESHNDDDTDANIHFRSLNDSSNNTKSSKSKLSSKYHRNAGTSTDVEHHEISDNFKDVAVQTATPSSSIVYKDCVFYSYKNAHETISKTTSETIDDVLMKPHQLSKATSTSSHTTPPNLPPRTKKLYSIIKEIRDAVKVDNSKRGSKVESRSELPLGTFDQEVASRPRDDFNRRACPSPGTGSSPVILKATYSETNTNRSLEEHDAKVKPKAAGIQTSTETQTAKSTNQHIVKITLKPEDSEQLISEQLSELLSKTLSMPSHEKQYHGYHDYSYIGTPDTDTSHEYTRTPKRRSKNSRTARRRPHSHREVFFAEKISDRGVRLNVTPQALHRMDSNRISEERENRKQFEESIQSYRRSKIKSKHSICRKCNRRKIKRTQKI